MAKWTEYIDEPYEDNSTNGNQDDNRYSDVEDEPPIPMNLEYPWKSWQNETVLDYMKYIMTKCV